jgi:hypothetical protein
MAIIYFSDKSARRASRAFYRELGKAIETDAGTVEKIVKRAMEQSISIRQEGRNVVINDQCGFQVS